MPILGLWNETDMDPWLDENDTDTNYTIRRRGRNYVLISSLITSYSIIFLLSFVGNSLVIVTLVRHRRMRTVTNMLLLNLAVSDLLMTFMCVAPSLAAFLIKKYIFGPFMCPFQRYIQGTCIAVSVYTLMTISIERFFAIVMPLWSRRWQTVSHVKQMIIGVWIAALIVMSPLAMTNRLDWLHGINVYKCDETWPSYQLQLLYSVAQMVLVHNIPLLVMLISYRWIAHKLWQSLHLDLRRHSGYPKLNSRRVNRRAKSSISRPESCLEGGGSHEEAQQINQPSDIDMRARTRAVTNNKKIVEMLIVVVLEFFLCWTPVFVLNVWAAIDGSSAKRSIIPGVRILITLMSYCSCCCNPITYCFMNERFRHYFLGAFSCCLPCRKEDTLRRTQNGLPHIPHSSRQTDFRLNSMAVTDQSERNRIYE